MTTVRFKDPQAIAERVGTFAANVKETLARGEKLVAERTEPVNEDAARRALEEALEVVNVQHAELVVAEEELREQVDELARSLGTVQIERERYRELFDAAPDAYFVTDVNGVIREANQNASAMLGVDARFMCGKPLTVYLTSEGIGDFRNALLATEKGTIELRVDVAGRKMAPVRTLMRAHRLESGRRILWIARKEERQVSSDVEDVTRALRDTQDLLERERRERERLERETRAKDRFLAILSHDLRAPLNAVLGWTDLLRRELLDQARRERALSTIDRNARALLGLIEELLDISRINADRMQLDVRPLDVSALVRRVVEATHPTAREKGVVLGCSIEDGGIVVADQKRIEQSVTNLLANALSYTPSGGRIDVSVARLGDHVSITVKDTGAGIPPATLPHVFECFQQGGEPGAKGGLGLGLFIVRQIAHLHGGTAHAQSDGEGRGSTFTIELPVADKGPPAAESASRMPARADLSSFRVLVVDDDEDTRDLLATLLSDSGANVASAGDTSSAIGLMDNWSPNVVISDMSMSTHDDGLHVVRAARDRLGEDAIVVALTGFASDRDASRSLAAGFDAHLAKPLGAGELIAALLRLRESRGGSD